jgi:hypothetical protein
MLGCGRIGNRLNLPDCPLKPICSTFVVLMGRGEKVEVSLRDLIQMDETVVAEDDVVEDGRHPAHNVRPQNQNRRHHRLHVPLQLLATLYRQIESYESNVHHSKIFPNAIYKCKILEILLLVQNCTLFRMVHFVFSLTAEMEVECKHSFREVFPPFPCT